MQCKSLWIKASAKCVNVNDSAPVSDTRVLSSRIGNILVYKLLVVLGTCLFLVIVVLSGTRLSQSYLVVIVTCLF